MDGLLNSFEGVLPEEFAGMLGFPIILVAVLILGLTALYSYRIFKIMLTVSGVLGAGISGYLVVAPLILKSLASAPEAIDLQVIIGLVMALLGGLLINLLFKVALFLSGAASGFLAGVSVILPLLINQFPDSEFFTGNAGMWVVGGICALILGILCIFLFKFLYITISSVGGMTGAAVLIGSQVAPTGGTIVLIVSALVGVIAGIFAAVHQYKVAAEY